MEFSFSVIFTCLFIFFVLAPICTSIFLFGKDGLKILKNKLKDIKDSIYF